MSAYVGSSKNLKDLKVLTRGLRRHLAGARVKSTSMLDSIRVKLVVWVSGVGEK